MQIMRRFFVPKLSIGADGARFSPEEARHLVDVVRLREGDRVRIFDGEGAEFEGVVRQDGKRSVTVAELERVEPYASESPLRMTLAVALTKGDRFDLAVQKAVELGVTTFVPLLTERCEVKLKDSQKKLERWNRMVIEASKQCGRAILMQIAPPKTLDELISSDLGDAEVLLFTERSGQKLDSSKRFDEILVLIGPEGGWADSELELAKSKGVKLVTLNGRILRAETASIAVAAIVQNLFGDLN